MNNPYQQAPNDEKVDFDELDITYKPNKTDHIFYIASIIAIIIVIVVITTMIHFM